MEVIHIKPAHEDDRGKIYDVIDNEEIMHAGIVTFNKGAIRGKHYHKLSVQYNYVLSGKIKLTTKDLRTEGTEKKVFMLNEHDMILIPEDHYHELEAMEDTILLYFTPKSRDGSAGYEKDTYRLEL